MTEKELQSYEIPEIKDIKDLTKFITSMEKEGRLYETAPYAMALASYATFMYMADKLGVTGFQASWADMQFLSRTRGMEDGFRILDYSNLLYPQYENEFDLSMDKLIEENIEHLRPKAIKLLEKDKNDDGTYNAHEDIVAHWERIANWK
jgi:hypothetical protein